LDYKQSTSEPVRPAIAGGLPDKSLTQHAHDLCEGCLATTMLPQCTNEMEYLADTYVGNHKNGSRKCKVWKGKGKEQYGSFKSTPAGIQFMDNK
jgi:hypothetical protein